MCLASVPPCSEVRGFFFNDFTVFTTHKNFILENLKQKFVIIAVLDNVIYIDAGLLDSTIIGLSPTVDNNNVAESTYDDTPFTDGDGRFLLKAVATSLSLGASGRAN